MELGELNLKRAPPLVPQEQIILFKWYNRPIGSSLIGSTYMERPQGSKLVQEYIMGLNARYVSLLLHMAGGDCEILTEFETTPDKRKLRDLEFH